MRTCLLFLFVLCLNLSLNKMTAGMDHSIGVAGMDQIELWYSHSGSEV